MTCSSHCYIPLSLFLSLSLFIFLFLSIAFTRSIYHRPSGFLVPTPLRPWPRCVPEQEEPIARLAPLAAPVTSVHARREMQAVHIVVLRRPDADCWVAHSDKSTRGRNYGQCHGTERSQPQVDHTTAALAPPRAGTEQKKLYPVGKKSGRNRD